MGVGATALTTDTFVGDVTPRTSTVGPVNIQTRAPDFGVKKSMKHGLAHPRNVSSARIFRGARVTRSNPAWSSFARVIASKMGFHLVSAYIA
jgi:hypothetical protein